MKKTLNAILTLVFINSSQAGEEFFVGNSGVCTYGSIQAAIDDAPSNAEIRVVNNEINQGLMFENLNINKNLVIKGGYSSCGLAQLDSRADENRTIIDGTDSDNVVKITGDNLSVEISGFTLTGGVVEEGIGAGVAQGGGMSIQGDNNQVTLEQMTISDNEGFLGGGLHIFGVNNDIHLYDSLIEGNEALSGGGVYCEGAGLGSNQLTYHNLEITGNESIGALEINGHGGGIYLDRCGFRPRSLLQSENSRFIINSNHANNSGGGIYASGGLVYTYFGSLSLNVANFDMNDTGDGGGLYQDQGVATFGPTTLDTNWAFGGNGGGIYIENATIRVYDLPYYSCLQTGDSECLNFINNRAWPLPGTGVTSGGAMYLSNIQIFEDSTSLEHFPGVFEGNFADLGTAISLTNGSEFSIQNAYFIGNYDNSTAGTSNDSVIRVDGVDTQLQVSFSTFANNQNNAAFAVVNIGTLNLINSIIHEQSTSNSVMFNSPATTVTTGCNIYHEDQSVTIPLGDNSLVTDDPGFVDPENGNYHITYHSPAVDRCTTVGLGAIYADRDSNERPINIENIGNGIGSYDVGADEFSDIIFLNGFE